MESAASESPFFTSDGITADVPSQQPGEGEEEEGDFFDAESLSSQSRIYWAVLLPLCYLGNGLTLLSFYKFRWLRVSANTLIISMAVADMIGVTSLCVYIFGYHELFAIYLESPGVFRFVSFLVELGIFASFTHNVILAIERFLAVFSPFWYERHMPGRGYTVLIVGLWVGNAAVIGAFSLARYLVDVGVLAFNVDTGFVYMDIGLYALTCLVTVLLNGKVMVTAYKLGKVMPSAAAAAAGPEPEAEQASKDRKRLRRATQMFFKLVMIFVLTWLPYYVTVFMSLAGLTPPYLRDLTDAFTMLGFANYGLNFFVYGIFSKSFRLAYKRLLCPYLPVSEGDASIMTV